MKTTFALRDFLAFDRMIAPSFLTILYYIHMAIVMLLCVGFILKGLDSHYGGGMMVMGGLLGLVLGPLLVRLTYEFVIVLFKIHAHLASIDGKTGGEVGSVAISQPSMPITPAQVAPVATPISYRPPTIEPINPPNPPPAGPPKDFWSSETGQPVFLVADPPAPADWQGVLQKIRNLPLVFASLLVLLGVVSSYANVMGVSYSIKNSPLGLVALLGALGMMGISAMGQRWVAFMGCYIAVLLGTLLAYFDEKGYFQQVARGRNAMETANDMANSLVPGLSQYTQQATQNVPGAAQYLTLMSYVFLLAMLFAGYWALAGRYTEKGTPLTR